MKDQGTKWIGFAVLLILAFVAVVVKVARESKPDHQSADHMEAMRKAKAKKAKETEKQEQNGIGLDQVESAEQNVESEAPEGEEQDVRGNQA